MVSMPKVVNNLVENTEQLNTFSILGCRVPDKIPDQVLDSKNYPIAAALVFIQQRC